MLTPGLLLGSGGLEPGSDLQIPLGGPWCPLRKAAVGQGQEDISEWFSSGRPSS